MEAARSDGPTNTPVDAVDRGDLGGGGHRVGGAVAILFAVGLLASGLASSTVGGYAGSVVMDGLLHRSVPPVARRLITVSPAVLILVVGVDPTQALVGSQVVLSVGLPFALLPLLLLTRSRAVMGAAVNRPVTSIAAGGVLFLVVGLSLTRIPVTLVGLG